MPIYRDKTKDNRFIFDFNKRINGRQYRVKKTLPKGWTKTQAEEYGLAQEKELYLKASGVIKEAPLISDAILFYLNNLARDLKTYKALVCEFLLLEPFYENRRLDELDEVCAKYSAHAREQKLSPRTIQARIGYLCTACKKTWQMKKDFYEKDPTSHVIKPKVKNERQLYLSRKQVLQLARATKDKMVRRSVLIAFYSGMRLGEIARATIDQSHFVLQMTKNDTPRRVPIHPKIAYIARNPIPFQYNRIQNVIKIVKKQLGITEYHFHDLRHSAASAMVQKKVDLYTVGKVLGHKDIRSTTRYAHLATENLEEALLKIGSKK